MKNIKRTLALFFIIIGLTGLMTAAVSLINPISSNIPQAGNASDDSLTSGKNLLLILGYLGMFITGIALAVKNRTSEHKDE